MEIENIYYRIYYIINFISKYLTSGVVKNAIFNKFLCQYNSSHIVFMYYSGEQYNT